MFYRVLVLFSVLTFGLTPHSAAAQATPASSLLPGDLLRVEIWREGDLSGNFAVNPNGVVTLPLLGEKQVMGVPLDQLRDRLIADYRVYLQNPSISITPLRRIYVLGEVNKPGLYVVDPTVSLAGAVAVASGATPEGDMQRISILRAGEVLQRRVGPSETLQGMDLRSGDEIYVDRQSWFRRNNVILVTSAFSAIASIIVSVIISSSGK